jgi:hypothetical protein
MMTPWKLEKISRSNWDKYGRTGLQLVAGVGAVAAYGGAAVATGGAVAASGAAAGSAAAVVGAIPIVGLMEISAVALINHDNKVKVQTEFQRRRLKLSFSMNPGEPAAGSLFFPMIPDPQRLIVRGHDADGSFRRYWNLRLWPHCISNRWLADERVHRAVSS